MLNLFARTLIAIVCVLAYEASAHESAQPEKIRRVIIGCGNLTRGDDGVGPALIRGLVERGLPPGNHVLDAGASGIDIPYAMRNAHEVIIVDSSLTGGEPGILKRVPDDQLTGLKQPPTCSVRAFRWEHALALARSLLKDEYPKHITVYLIEVVNVDAGTTLSAPVAEAMQRLMEQLLKEMKEEP